LALSFFGLERLEGGQQGIEGFFGAGSTTGGQASTIVKRQRSASPTVKIPRSVIRKTTSDSKTKKQKQKSSSEIIEILSDSDGDITIEQDNSKWTCPKCRHVFSVSQEDDTADIDVQATQAKLNAIKREHEDFHLAQDLHHQERRGIKGENRKSTAATQKTQKKVKHKPPAKPDGIKAFFSPFGDSAKKTD
jgi:DNA polymerase eta